MYLLKQIVSVSSQFRKYAFLNGILWAVLLTGCNIKNGQDQFRPFSEDFAAQYFLLFPDESPLETNNLRLNKMFIPTSENMDSASVFYQYFSRELNGFSSVYFSAADLKDYQKIKNILNGVQTLISEREINPGLFNIRRSLIRILRTPYTRLPERLKTISEKLSLAPAFYEAAKNQVIRPDRVKSGQAIRSHIETYLFLDQELRDSLDLIPFPDPDFLSRIERAKLSVKDYIGFCESAKLN